MATIQEDFDRIDVMLRQLQVKWDLFFNGAEKKPPTELQGQVETLIKRLNNTEIRNNGDRFRFQGLSARYTAFNELWQKKIRAREEGRAYGRHGIKAEQSAPMRPMLAEPAPAKPEAPREYRIADAARDGAAVRALYDQLVEERRRIGEASPAFETFQSQIGKQAQKIRTELGAQAVSFRLETRDGKVALKAKVVK